MRGEDYYSYSSFVYYDGSVYYFTEVGGKLIKLNVSTNELSAVFQIKSYDEYLPYRKLVLCENVIYMIPYYRSSLISYNITTGESEVIELPEDVIKKVGEKPQYFGAYKDGNLIYMYGFNHTVTRYDYINDKFFIFELDNKNNQFSTWFRSGCCKKNNKIYIPFCENPYILVIDGDSYEVIKLNVQKANDFSFADVILYDGSICYIRENEVGNVYIDLFYDVLMDAPYKSYELKIEDGIIREKSEMPFFAGSVVGNKLFFWPGHTNVFCSFDLQTGKYKNYSSDHYLPRSENCAGKRCFFDIALDGNAMYSLLYRTNILCELRNGEISCHSVNISWEEKKDFFSTNCIVHEDNEFLELKDLISMITAQINKEDIDK